MSRKKVKLVYGIGVNDADYPVQPTVNGKQVECKYYNKWKKMLERCFSEKYKAKYPTYDDCIVCDDWILFSNFKAWMESKDWHGKDLDKDIKNPRNKLYSPDTCDFVSPEINKILNANSNIRGAHPQGVTFHKSKNRFSASISINNEKIHLGYFSNPKNAEIRYLQEKIKVLILYSEEEANHDIANGLIKHSQIMQEKLEMLKND